jgi:hypothetical protein
MESLLMNRGTGTHNRRRGVALPTAGAKDWE